MAMVSAFGGAALMAHPIVLLRINPATKLRKVVVVVFAAASLVEDKCVQTDLPRKLEREENLCRR